MKNWNAQRRQTRSRILLTASATAVAAAFALALPQPAYANDITVPPVPTDLQVPAGNQAFLVGHAVGTQNYVCLPSGAGVAFTLFTPDATLFNDDDKQIITHSFSPNPFENNANPALTAVGPIRAAWQYSRDSSIVWGQVKPHNSAVVDPTAIAWLKVTAVGADTGPTGGDTLAHTTFIQRLNTVGGLAPSTGCASAADVGHLAFVPYTADYFFYRATDDRADQAN